MNEALHARSATLRGNMMAHPILRYADCNLAVLNPGYEAQA